MNRRNLLLTIGACLAASLPVWAQVLVNDGSEQIYFEIEGTTRAEIFSTGIISATAPA